MNYPLIVDPQVAPAMEKFTPPQELVFGRCMIPFMLVAEYKDGRWGELELKPFGPLQLLPSVKVLHYAQEIFEGLKAYQVAGDGPYLFRPDQNYERMNFSATRMAMPEVPREMFFTAIEVIAGLSHRWIPKRTGESLYIRPFMIATEANLGIKPSEEFTFITIASPAGNYFVKDSVSVLIEKERSRANPGGVGEAKTGGNYAAAQLSSIERAQMGHDQTLWTDAVTHTYAEELSGMNVFALVNNVLCTPRLSGTILKGITRDSVMKIAQSLNLEVKELDIKVEDLKRAIEDGSCSEMFACGTAVIITPINSLNEKDGSRFNLAFPKGNLSMQIRQKLLDIQEGRSEDQFGWRHSVEKIELKNLE